MQKIEKWRVEELALVLNELAELLKAGEHSEWANVFLHFLEETEKIISQQEFDSKAIEKLARNILNCFDRNSSFVNITLKNENPREEQKLNQTLLLTRARLLNLLNDIQERIIEHIH